MKRPRLFNTIITAFDADHVEQLSKLRNLRNTIIEVRNQTPARLMGSLGETERAELDEIANKVAQMFNRRFQHNKS